MCACIPWFTYNRFWVFCTFLCRESVLVTETRFKGRACWCPTCRLAFISRDRWCYIYIVTCILTYKTGSGLDDWIYCTLYIHTTLDYRQHSAIGILHTFQFTVTHAVGFSVFTSRILATDLLQSHCNFKSHFTAWFLSCHYSEPVSSEDSTLCAVRMSSL
jgi:hypothetical protein